MQGSEPYLSVLYRNSYPSLPLDTSALQEGCKTQLAHNFVCPCSCSNPSMEASDTQSSCHTVDQNNLQASLFALMQHPQR
uniref:AGO908 n=1 Tax=Arundo donax TaxID=35708 RepID=A0A0A9DHQ2_ARUDO